MDFSGHDRWNLTGASGDNQRYWDIQLDPDLLETIVSIYPEWFKDCNMNVDGRDSTDNSMCLLSSDSKAKQENGESLQRPIDKNKESLKVKLMLRRPLNQLVDQGILPSLKSPPSFHEQRQKLERAKMGDLLKHKLQKRPDRQELIQQHILDESCLDSSQQEKQKQLKNGLLADNLSGMLSQRPGSIDLVKGNIINADELLAQAVRDDFMRGRIIGKIKEGRKITDVAREFDIAHGVVSRLWKSFKTTGMYSRRHGGGRVRSTTPAEDRYIVLSAKRNRRTTAQQVANKFLAASGKQISRKTVARRLRGGGLYARRPVVCVPLTRQHRTARLQWCREHHNWTKQDRACVLFSDESRFSLSSDCRRQLIWRESGTAYRPENIQEKDRYPTCSIMVWAGIMINGRTRLHVVANGTMMGQRYIDELLLPHVRLFRGAVGDKFVFMDDNATCHRTLAVRDCLDSEGIQRLVWPARSPDLNPIENVWDALGKQVAGRNYPPTNKNTLIRALTEEWDKLPQQLLDNVVQSVVRRVERCITLHGGHIPY
ncbi:hypothetical protein TNCV_3661301 [Trichonephila clavipes]|nr:hypothetical protein TNCV_3661301 [Trichonephila clavipes]